MLETCINHPKIFDQNEYNSEKFYYKFIKEYFNKIIKNGIILDINGDFLSDEINKNIELWPENHRKYLKEQIEQLKKMNRIVKLDKKEIYSNKDCSLKNVCGLFYSVLEEQPKGIVVNENCLNKMQNINNLVTLYDVDCSDFYKNMDDITYILDNSFELDKFKDEIMRPLFRYCKHIKIIDRMFGNHVNRKNYIEIGYNYRIGLEKIIEMVKEYNVNSNKVTIEIYTSIHPKSKKIPEKIDVFYKYILDLRKKYDIKLDCYFKKEFRDMPHDRYIFTNQIGVQVGRGIDIFYQNGNLRDTTISITNNEDKSKFETKVRTLEDLAVIK